MLAKRISNSSQKHVTWVAIFQKEKAKDLYTNTFDDRSLFEKEEPKLGQKRWSMHSAKKERSHMKCSSKKNQK